MENYFKTISYMTQKTVTVSEDFFKKALLIMKHSKEFVKLEPQDLFLGNLWRVAPKLAEQTATKCGYVFVDNKGRKTVKLKEEVEVTAPEVNTKGTETGRIDTTEETSANLPKEAPVEEKPAEVEAPKVEEEKPVGEIPVETKAEEEQPKVHRCRKRKNKK